IRRSFDPSISGISVMPILDCKANGCSTLPERKWMINCLTGCVVKRRWSTAGAPGLRGAFCGARSATEPARRRWNIAKRAWIDVDVDVDRGTEPLSAVRFRPAPPEFSDKTEEKQITLRLRGHGVARRFCCCRSRRE